MLYPRIEKIVWGMKMYSRRRWFIQKRRYENSIRQGCLIEFYVWPHVYWISWYHMNSLLYSTDSLHSQLLVLVYCILKNLPPSPTLQHFWGNKVFNGWSSGDVIWVVIWDVIWCCHLSCYLGYLALLFESVSGLSSCAVIWVVIWVVIWRCHLSCFLGCHLPLSFELLSWL
jgi:hypothetical protein